MNSLHINLSCNIYNKYDKYDRLIFIYIYYYDDIIFVGNI